MLTVHNKARKKVIRIERKVSFKPDEYKKIIYDFAKAVNNLDLMRILRWNFFDDEFRYTKIGVLRWKCALSLEFLFRNIIRRGGDWSNCHSIFAKKAEETNLVIAKLYLDTLGEGNLVPDDIKRKIDNLDKTTLNLMYRGFFKTSIFTVAHAIQECIINPNIRSLIISGTMSNSSKILNQLKSPFIHNNLFRVIFPDMCPTVQKTGKIEFGTTEEVTLPNRTFHDVREPSIKCGSVTSNLTGLHFDRMFIDDIIDESNCNNEDQIKASHDMFRMIMLLFNNPVDPFYTINGTIYHFNDVYCELIREREVDGKIKFCTYDPITKKAVNKDEKFFKREDE